MLPEGHYRLDTFESVISYIPRVAAVFPGSFRLHA